MHQQLAVKLLFTEQQESILQLEEKQQIEQKDKETLAMVGIVQIAEDNPHFIHRTFAENYAAHFLAQRLNVEQGQQNLHEHEFLMKDILLKSDYEVVRVFLNGQFTKKLPPYSTLTEYGQYITELWSADADSLRNLQKETVLHIACIEGHIKIINFLLQSLKAHPYTLKAMVEAKDNDGKTALHLAAYSGNAESVKGLLDYVEANLESKDDYKGTLIAMVKAKDNNERTALHLAAHSGNAKSVKALLDYVEANLESKDDYKGTLIAMVKAKDSDGETALHRVAYYNKAEMFQALLDCVKSYPKILQTLVETKTKNGQTALHLAAYSANAESVKGLLDYVEANLESKDDCKGTLIAMVKAKDNNGRTALHCAAYSNKAEMVQGLMDSAVIGGVTPSQRSEKRGKIKVVEALLDSMISYPEIRQTMVKAKDNDGRTFLHGLAQEGHLKILARLLNPGGNINNLSDKQ